MKISKIAEACYILIKALSDTIKISRTSQKAFNRFSKVMNKAHKKRMREWKASQKKI